MDCEFHIQDPRSPDTIYLLEAIVGASRGAASCSGIFAFASRNGVDYLVDDPGIRNFLSESSMCLVVGIDAVTNRQALVRLQELEQEIERLTVRVFWNPTGALFHPKVARFEYPDGRRTLVVGSGNLTPGGLHQNFEAFSVIRSEADETLDITSWDRFLAEYASDLRPIDEEALAHAARNVVRGRQRRPGVVPVVVETPIGDKTTAGPVRGTDRFLVAQVPKAKKRWRQIHFNLDVIKQFFRVRPDSAQRVFLVECRQDGSFGEQEVRPCVYSKINKNPKIEAGARRRERYPDSGQRPVAVYRELQLRSFAYMLLLPGEPGYDAMLTLTADLPKVGQGLRRVFADGSNIRSVWPACPLVTSID